MAESIRGNADVAGFCLICGEPAPCSYGHIFEGNAPKGATAGAPDVTLRPTGNDLATALVPWGYAPGDYECRCLRCGVTHTADKRAAICRDCAVLRMRADHDAQAARIRELEAERELALEACRLIIAARDTGDEMAAVEKAEAFIKVAEGSREAALHQSPGSPPKTEDV